VMRHRSVQTKSMYSLRRGQIEHKVRAARQRTLGPQKRPADAATAMAPTGAPAGPVEIVTDVAPAYAPPPGEPPPPSPSRHVWDIGPTAPPPAAAAPKAPPPPAPPPPVYAPEPPTEPLPPEPVWTPTPADIQQAPAGAATGSEAGWEVVGEPGESNAPASGARGRSRQAAGAGWEIVGGPNADDADEVKRPSVLLAVAQYVVLVLGLMIVLFGVLVIIANSNSG
jgi:hypothetical protein